ncbi:peptidase domain-containing ABC transporter [Burkholderia sp. JSH-S8]|uniref:peptidase domain-containing ABC transporter n=1 Tax=Burkholderia stagnalis TaxID=1503054 RepID=UPI000F806500|nr:peptidase domain-containing ABC transporter [Burkholderia stagnalis]WGS44624.1 peptidase domain-containing ABC transporter [Burkholderia sp. JSH-S8]
MKKKVYLDNIFGTRFPTVLQTESTECGLACVAMLANYHGRHVTLRDLRLKFSVSLKGISLGALLRVCKHNGLSSRPIRTEIAGLEQIKLPCILHWNFNHFVVLRKIGAEHAIIVDPAYGERRIELEALSRAFTGVAVEVWPDPEFAVLEPRKHIPLTHLMGNLRGRMRALTTILSLAIGLEFLVALSPYYIQLVIDSAIGANDQYVIAALAIGFGIVYLLKNVIGSVRSWFLMYLSTSLNVQWKDNVLEHMLALPLEYYEKRHMGDVLSRFGAIDAIQRMLTTSFVESMLDGAFSVVILLVLFIFQPQLGVLVLVSALLYIAARWLLNASILRASRNELVHGAKQNSYLLETIRGIRQVKLYGQQAERRLSWMSLFVNQTNAKIRTLKIDVWLKFARTLIFDIQNIVVVWCGAVLVIDRECTVGALVAFLGYKMLFESRVIALIDNVFVIQNMQLQADRLGDIVLSKPEETRRDLECDIAGLSGSLECKDLFFQYSLFERNVIDGLNFKVEEGESVAIIGPSGCGKSTIFNVILGIYQGARGRILIGGEDAKSMSVEKVRAVFGTVLQDDSLFGGSIAENISGFDARPDPAWIAKCAAMANIEDEIEAMPMKYSTLVGDMGAVLSGGQKQRILLARALYKRPKILLLDEATSHLDVSNEKAVNRAIKSLKITRIIVAHRPETVLSADRIMLMKNGRIDSILTPAEATTLLESINGSSV